MQWFQNNSSIQFGSFNGPFNKPQSLFPSLELIFYIIIISLLMWLVVFFLNLQILYLQVNPCPQPQPQPRKYFLSKPTCCLLLKPSRIYYVNSPM